MGMVCPNSQHVHEIGSLLTLYVCIAFSKDDQNHRGFHTIERQVRSYIHITEQFTDFCGMEV